MVKIETKLDGSSDEAHEDSKAAKFIKMQEE